MKKETGKAVEQSNELTSKISQWKNKFGSDCIFQYEVDGYSCYLRKPTRQILSAAIVTGQGDPVRYTETIVNNCWLDGDEIIRKDDGYLLGLSKIVDQMVGIKEGELKKV